MQAFKKCPHCGSGVWVIPYEEPNCEVCGCDTDVLADADEKPVITHMFFNIKIEAK